MFIKPKFIENIMTVKIKDVEYNVKYTIRAMFLFEQITGKNFELKTTLDNYIFFYSLLLANNSDKEVLQWDDFLDAIDTDPKILKTLLQYLADYHKNQKIFETDEEDEETGEKKN